MRTITVSIPARNLTLSQNGTEQNQSAQQPSSGLGDLLKANTQLAVWLIFLSIGGGLLALYYIRIGYLPEMDWNAAMVYLFVGSVFGGVIGLLLTIALYLPGVIWCEIIIFETTLDNHLTYFAEHDDSSGKPSKRKEPCIRSIMRHLGIPFGVALLISHVGLRASGTPVIKLIDLYLVVAALVLAGTFVYIWVKFNHQLRLKQCPKEEQETLSRQVFRYSLWFTFSVLLNQLSMYVIYRLADRTPNTDDFLILTGWCTTCVWVSTHVVATRHRYYPRQALLAALAASLVLLFMADRFSSLSMKLMSRYGIGEDKNFNLLVKPDLVTLLKSEGVCTCGPQHVCNVEMLSKIGDHYFVRVDSLVDRGGDCRGKNVARVKITLPKADVIAIKRLYSP